MARKKDIREGVAIKIDKETKESTVVEMDFHETFKENFRDYGNYVIEYRALPDIRDGLKPVYRRIIYRMGENKNTSDRKLVKVAKTTGDVIGIYHPHGDKAVEDALVNLATPWKHTMPAIKIKGNIGSVFGDPHGAGRYIEAKLSETGDSYIKNMKPGIVEYEPNYDETTQIAKVLPARLPYLLINGDEGIAVGFASSLPTHNPIEVINGFIAYVKKPKITQAELMEYIPGPDFPTAGEIINKDDLPTIYKNGDGQIYVRGKVRYDKKDNSLHIYEIPFTSAGSMDKLVENITKATMETETKVKGKVVKKPPKYPWATEVMDHSGRDGIDIKLTLQKGVNPDIAIQELYAKTPLETTLTYKFQALNDRHLNKYSIKRYFKEYLAFQHELLINENQLRKDEIVKRLEIIDGLLMLQEVVDEVVSSAKASNGKKELQEVLMTGKLLEEVPKKFHKKIKAFNFTEVQAEHIANLPIYKINKMDSNELVKEHKKLSKEQTQIQTIIDDPAKRKRTIIKQHEDDLKKLDPQQYARKTVILQAEKSKAVEFETPLVNLYTSIDNYGYVTISEKVYENSLQTSNKERLVFITNEGIVYPHYLDNYKTTSGRGTLVNQLISVDDSIIGMSTLVDKPDREGLFVFKDGNIKVVKMSRYLTKNRSSKIIKDKTEFELLAYVDIPENAKTVTINGKTLTIDKLSHGNGHGKNEFKSGLDRAEIEFDTVDTVEETSNDGLVIFDGSDTVRFDWDSLDESKYKALYVVKYSELLEQDVLFVHDDGTAKIVEGSQFEVKTRRSEIQGNKKGVTSIYIGQVPETLLGIYDDGKQKKIESKLISRQGKVGGGARAFYSKKSKIKEVKDGRKSDLPLSSLAQQPK